MILKPTILDKIKWNSKPSSPTQVKNEAARRAKTRHFPIPDLGGGGGGLGFPFILSKIVACLLPQAKWNTILSLTVLLVCTWRHGGHVGGQEQKHFSPLGTKLYFHVNSSRKYSFILTPNMATLSRGCKPRICRCSFHRCFILAKT